MRVFVVRHEKRNRGDATFLSPLLPEGHADARGQLVEVIAGIQPTHIYASPFLRVLQTVKPYLEATHLHAQSPPLLNVDYSLYESPNPDHTGAIGELHPDWAHQFHISPTYASFTPPSRLQDGWGFGDSLPERTASFLAHLVELHGDDPEARVLLASHQYTIHSLMSLTTGQDVQGMNFPQGEVAELEWRNANLLTT
jgi:broad specificity phosphatase PhoE